MWGGGEVNKNVLASEKLIGWGGSIRHQRVHVHKHSIHKSQFVIIAIVSFMKNC